MPVHLLRERGHVKYDLLIKGGLVHPPGSVSAQPLDVAVADGRISAIEPALDESLAASVLDVAGKTLVPGLIDLHTHAYWAGTPLGVDPDVLAPGSGVTTWIDAGSAGAGNIAGLVRHVVERSHLTIRLFLHVSYIGLLPVGNTDLRFGELFDFRLADARAWLRELEVYSKHIVGIKVRLGHTSTGSNGMDALRVARALGDATGLPVMVHVANPPPLLVDVLSYLKRGDIVTHCFTPGLMGILDRHRNVLPEAWKARERGVLFDVAHGSGGFSFEVAEAAIAAGFFPDILSSDLHAYNVDGPVFDLVTTLMKFLAMGMSFDDVLRSATTIPAQVVRDTAKGSIAVGADADFAVIRQTGDHTILGDAKGNIRHYDKRLIVDNTISRGRVLERIDGPPQGKWKPGLPKHDDTLTRPPHRMSGPS